MPNQNSLPNLIEVLMRLSEHNDSNIPEREVRVELRVHSILLEADDCMEFTVELDKANLALDLDGFDVVPKSRFGEPTKPNDVSIEHKVIHETTRQAELGGKLDGTAALQPSGSISANASASAGVKATHSASGQQTQRHLRVKARGNLIWEVTEPSLQGPSKPLDDTYLHDDVLCKVKALPGANQLAAKLVAFARKRDIRINAKKQSIFYPFRSVNHEKMLNVLIAKVLNSSPSNGGILTFSVSEVRIENDAI
jgi:hypothetical protein